METYSNATCNLVSNLYKEGFRLTNKDDLAYEGKILVFESNHQYTPSDLDHTFDVKVEAHCDRLGNTIELLFTLDGSKIARKCNLPSLFKSKFDDNGMNRMLKHFIDETVKDICEQVVPTLKLQKLLSEESL